MPKAKKSYDLPVPVPHGVTRAQAMTMVETAAAAVGLTISHIGGYSRRKYPDAIHWHFKRDRRERGLIDATFWEGGPILWLMIRHREPQWVHDTAPLLHRALAAETAKLRAT